MSLSLTVDFLAPIPKGHRVQVIRLKRWTTPLFSGASYWDDVSDPVLLDLDTGIVYCNEVVARSVTLEPLGFDPRSHYQVATRSEARASACMVSCSAGDYSTLRTVLVLSPVPTGYRD